MNKLLLTVLLFALPVNSFAAQQPLQTRANTASPSVDTNFTRQQAMNTDLYTNKADKSTLASKSAFFTAFGWDTGVSDYASLTNKPTIPSALSDLSADTTHRVVTDAEKTTWNGKANTSAFASSSTFQAAFGWSPSGTFDTAADQTITGDWAFSSGLEASNISLNLGTLTDLKIGNAQMVDDTKGNGDTNFLWSADKIFDKLALKSDTTHNHTGTYEPADANIIKVNEIDTLAKFEALLGWSPGSGGSFAFDTFPTYEDSAHTSGIAVNATTLAVYSTAVSKWLTVGLTDTLNPAPVTYSLTITPASFTGADKFTYNSTDYTTQQVITGLSADASFTVTPDAGRAITCTGTGLTDNTDGSYTANTDTASVTATCTSAASLAIFASNTTAGATVQFGQETGREYVGQMITGAGTHVIKKVTFRAANISGDISGKTYACAIYSRSGSALDTALAVSANSISGSAISSGTVLEFTFTGQSTTTGNAVVIYETGAVDVTNYLNLDYSATNTDASYSEYTRWGESKLATGGSTGDLWYALYE